MTDPIAKARSLNPSLASSVAERYAKPLRRYLFRQLHGPQDVDDLAQEIYLRLLRTDPEMQVRNPVAFVFTIAARVVANHRAAAASERGNVPFDEDVDVENESCKSVSDALAGRLRENANIHEQIEEALSQLDPKQAALLLMIKRDGRSAKEAAVKFGLSVPTIHYHLRTARAKLRRLRWENGEGSTEEDQEGS